MTQDGFTSFKINSDGSCLFNAISQAMEKTNKSDELRSTVAALILSNESKYNVAWLGNGLTPSEYCEWICKPNEWGGMPELRLLSQFYNTQLTVVDIGEEKLIKFSGDDGSHVYQDEVFLMFDGSHYNLGIKDEQRVFKVQENCGAKFLELAKELKAAGLWVDPALFALKCSDCGKAMEG